MKNKFIPAFILILAMFDFSFNTRWAIKGLTNTLFWHLTQFSSLFLILFSGILYGIWHKENISKNDFWHNWGEIISIGLLSILVYVFSLHYLTIKF